MSYDPYMLGINELHSDGSFVGERIGGIDVFRRVSDGSMSRLTFQCNMIFQ